MEKPQQSEYEGQSEYEQQRRAEIEPTQIKQVFEHLRSPRARTSVIGFVYLHSAWATAQD